MRLFMISGCCGSGKSTMKDALSEIMDSERYACIDCDETGFNWWDYAGTDHESKYHDDCIAEAVRRAAGRDLILYPAQIRWILLRSMCFRTRWIPRFISS